MSADRRSSLADTGSITGFVVVLVLAVVMCAGLALDGGRIVGAKVAAGDAAENAARAGAQVLTDPHQDPAFLDPVGARAAAQGYLAAHGMTGSVSATPGRVTVTVTVTVGMSLLGLVGISSKTVSATRSAVPINHPTG
jgi:Flp pilus assembly protein TadG